MAIAPAIVADLYPIERRSFAMGIVLVLLHSFLSFDKSLITSSLFKLSRQLWVPSVVDSLHNVSAGAGHIGSSSLQAVS